MVEIKLSNSYGLKLMENRALRVNCMNKIFLKPNFKESDSASTYVLYQDMLKVLLTVCLCKLIKFHFLDVEHSVTSGTLKGV
ncbi:CLUMA_CG001575, isoform A [Clunio marinus]|uniref:CLUMA_CG001575, isoform A n=1 Tax=Clunio marinus TaxID=568069 RepID=A0A1J1HIP7_9DIPT|nr:CLUMA_CG001575, isoform A [Clunio marinus]